MVKLSYSTISSYLACPAKVYFSLRDDVKIAKGAALVYGSIFHEMLSYRLAGKERTAADAIVPYLIGKSDREKDWNGIIQFSKNDWPVDAMMNWLDSTVDQFIAWLKGPRTTLPQAVELRLSNAYKADQTTYQFSGVVDALWDGVLIDFKLAGSRYKPDPLQAACYAILNGGPSRFAFAVAYKEKTPRFEIKQVANASDASYLSWVEKRVVIPVAKAIDAGNFPANPSYQWCSEQWCPYWSVCQKK